MGALAYANRKRRTSESPRRIQAARAAVRRRVRRSAAAGQGGVRAAVSAGSPALAAGQGRFADAAAKKPLANVG